MIRRPGELRSGLGDVLVSWKNSNLRGALSKEKYDAPERWINPSMDEPIHGYLQGRLRGFCKDVRRLWAY